MMWQQTRCSVGFSPPPPSVLSQTLEWCLDLGVQMVTVYAFSIENFKRSPQEVQALMKLAREQFLKLLEKSDMIQRNGICVRVLGDVSLLPRDLQEAIAKAVTLSRNNTRCVDCATTFNPAFCLLFVGCSNHPLVL